MDSSTCSWLTKDVTHAQHLTVDYDCILYEPEPSSMPFNHLTHTNNHLPKKTETTKKGESDDQNIVLFSAKINIESPPDLINDSLPNSVDLTDEERAWKEFILKQYLNGKRPPLNDLDKPIIIQQQRSLLSDILRTVIILIVFTFILIVLMLIGLFLYKYLTSMHKRKFFGHRKDQQQKHAPFPSDEAYDNLKTSAAGSTADSATATDV